MDEGSIEHLELRDGARVTAAHLLQLDRLIARNNALRGVGVRRRQYPWGTSHSYSGGGGLVSAPVFQPQVSLAGATAQVRWSGPRALIGGVAPTIGTAEIFTPDPSTGLLPALDVPALSGALASVFFKLVVDPFDFTINTVTPVVLAKPPVNVPYTAFLLALFLRFENGAITYDEGRDRQLFSAQGFFAVNRRPNGVFTPLFWATF